MANEGTASIKIVGDVSDFARQVERDLNKALNSISIDEIKIDVDSDHLRREAEQAGRNAGKSAGDGARRSFWGSFGRDDGQSSGFGRKALSGVTSALSSGLSGLASILGPIVSVVGGTVAGAFVAAVAGAVVPALAAAITSAVGLGLGAGLIGLGALALKDVKSFQDAAKGLGKTLKEVGQQAARPLLKPLVTALGDLSELARQLKPEFTSIFRSLAKVIGPLNQALGETLGSIVRGIKDSMPGVTAAFDGLTRALPAVGDIIADVFRDVFGNADLIDNTTEGLVRFFTEPLRLLGPLISGLTVLFGVWNNLVNLIANSDAIPRLTDQILAFVDGGTGAIGRIRDAWGPVSDAIQVVWDKLKAFAAEDDTTQLAQRFQDVVDAIKEAWGPLREFLGTVWSEALAFVKRLWDEEFVPWWGQTATPWIREAIESAFQVAWDAAGQVTTDRLAALRDAAASWLGQLPALIGGFLAQLPATIGNALSGVPGAFATAFSTANTAVSDALAAMGGAILIALNQLPTLIANILRELPTVAVDALAALIIAIGNVLSSIPGIVTRAFTSGRNAAVSGATGVVSGALSALRNLPTQVGRAISGIQAAILNVFSGSGRWLYNAGVEIMNGLIEGIQRGIARVRELLRGVTATLPDWKGPAAVDRTILRDSGRMVMQGFEQGLRDQQSSIRSALGGLTGDLASMTNGPGHASTNLSGGVTFNINVSGVTGQQAGERAAEAALDRLAQAGLVRGR